MQSLSDYQTKKLTERHCLSKAKYTIGRHRAKKKNLVDHDKYESVQAKHLQGATHSTFILTTSSRNGSFLGIAGIGLTSKACEIPFSSPRRQQMRYTASPSRRRTSCQQLQSMGPCSNTPVEALSRVFMNLVYRTSPSRAEGSVKDGGGATGLSVKIVAA